MEIQLPMAVPPWKGLGKRLESACRKAIYDYQMIDGSPIAVALSGGKDSLSLLFLLAAIRGRGFPDFRLEAIHVDGEYTCGAGVNGTYLRAICDRLEVPLTIKTSTKKLENLECYSCSRERRSILFHTAKEKGANVVAFGHHRDDNAQTILMNLLHKGEFAGVLPKIEMVEYDVTIIRPLIYLSEEELRTFASSYGFLRITCQCPVGQRSQRKQVDQILSNLETKFPEARNNIARAGLIYGSEKARRVS